MSWFIWPVNFCCGTQSERDRYSKSIGSKYPRYCWFAFKRFFKTGIDLSIDSFSACMVFYEQLVAGFCLPHQDQLVGVYYSRIHSSFNCIDNCKYSIRKSSDCKSGEEFENGISSLQSLVGSVLLLIAYCLLLIAQSSV